MTQPRILVAGVGNIFFGDDGFGVEVVRRLASRPANWWPKGSAVTVTDFGIRGLHLAYELGEPYQRVLVVDALPHEQLPGSLIVLEPDLGDLGGAGQGGTRTGASPQARQPDAHGMDLGCAFATARALGASLPPIVVVGCEPDSVDEGMGLSRAVARAVEPAVDLIRDLIARAPETGVAASSPPPVTTDFKERRP